MYRAHRAVWVAQLSAEGVIGSPLVGRIEKQLFRRDTKKSGEGLHGRDIFEECDDILPSGLFGSVEEGDAEGDGLAFLPVDQTLDVVRQRFELVRGREQ